jgi:hypothetical protein
MRTMTTSPPTNLTRPDLQEAALTAIDVAVAVGGRPVTCETLVMA